VIGTAIADNGDLAISGTPPLIACSIAAGDMSLPALLMISSFLRPTIFR
jgi:hypothetical protein